MKILDRRKHIFSKLATVMLFALIFACSESGFEGGNGSRTSSNQNNNNNINSNYTGDDAYINADYFSQVANVATQKFNLASAVSKRVDIVWVIDNSGSMAGEAEIVRNNFTSFIQTLDSKTSLKVALISTNVGSTQVTLPRTGSNFLHVTQRIESWDALYTALYATCQRETNNFNNHILCGQQNTAYRQAFYSSYKPEAFTSGSLSGFFRPDAHRVYVFVTDDDAKGVDSSNFLPLLTIANLKFTPTIFAFAALPTSKKCYSKVGGQYVTLAAKTGGKVFDVCSSNWSQHYSELTSGVETIANTEFLLRKRPADVLEIKIDNQPLNSSQYSLIGQKIKLNQGLISPASRELEIRYRVSN